MNEKNIVAIQFNGWNSGYIYDWVSGKTGLYPTWFENEIEVNGVTVHHHDWVVKNEDGSFEIMSNIDYQNKLDEEYAKETY